MLGSESDNLGAESENGLLFMIMGCCSHPVLFNWDPPRSYELFMPFVLICGPPITPWKSAAVGSTCIATLGERLFCSLRAISKLVASCDARTSFCLSCSSNLLAAEWKKVSSYKYHAQPDSVSSSFDLFGLYLWQVRIDLGLAQFVVFARVPKPESIRGVQQKPKKLPARLHRPNSG